MERRIELRLEHDPIWAVSAWKDCDFTGWLCHDKLRQFFAFPADTKRIDLIVSNRRRPESYRVRHIPDSDDDIRVSIGSREESAGLFCALYDLIQAFEGHPPRKPVYLAIEYGECLRPIEAPE